jgi:heme exporter protein A
LNDTTTSATSEAPLVLTGIGRRFRQRWALRGVSLRVDRGDVLALMGRNGTGKSTLLRVVAMLLRPSRGEGAIFGYDMVREASSARGLVGLLGHDNGLYEDLTAVENLRFVLRMLGRPADDAAIMSALSQVGLERAARDRVRTFSSGMQRRLAIARLRVQAPPLLLLDEPYNSIDSEGVQLVNELIASTRRAGGAAIVVVHDVDRVAGEATRWARLLEGRVETSDEPVEEPLNAARVEEVA